MEKLQQQTTAEQQKAEAQVEAAAEFVVRLRESGVTAVVTPPKLRLLSKHATSHSRLSVRRFTDIRNRRGLMLTGFASSLSLSFSSVKVRI